MIRRQPRATRTDTLFPYTTLFRSGIAPALEKLLLLNVLLEVRHRVDTGNERTFRGSRYVEHGVLLSGPIAQVFERTILRLSANLTSRYDVSVCDYSVKPLPTRWAPAAIIVPNRSDERRVGKECVSTCRYR